MICLSAEGSVVVWSSATFRIAISSKAAFGLSLKLTMQNTNTCQIFLQFGDDASLSHQCAMSERAETVLKSFEMPQRTQTFLNLISVFHHTFFP